MALAYFHILTHLEIWQDCQKKKKKKGMRVSYGPVQLYQDLSEEIVSV